MLVKRSNLSLLTSPIEHTDKLVWWIIIPPSSDHPAIPPVQHLPVKCIHL